MKSDRIRYKPNRVLEFFGARREALAVTAHLGDDVLTLPLHAVLADGDVVGVVDGIGRGIGSATS